VAGFFNTECPRVGGNAHKSLRTGHLRCLTSEASYSVCTVPVRRTPNVLVQPTEPPKALALPVTLRGTGFAV